MSDLELSFLKNIIQRNWFQEIDERHPHRWTFRDDLSELNDEQFWLVVQLCLEVAGLLEGATATSDAICPELRQGRLVKLADKEISVDLLERILMCITIAEYRLDALLLHPPKIRLREVKEICESVGMDRDTFIRIDQNWRERLRQKVFPESAV